MIGYLHYRDLATAVDMWFDSVICFDLLEYLPNLSVQLLELRYHVCEAVDKNLSLL